MTCDELKRQYAAFLEGPQDPSLGERMGAHLDACPSCAAWADGMVSDLKGLEPLLPRWRVTDEAWNRMTAKSASRRAFMAGYLWNFARAAAAAALVLAAVFFLRRTLAEKWKTAAAEQILEISKNTRILLSAGTQYRLERGEGGKDLILVMNRGEAVLGVEKGAFRSAGVDLSDARVRVVGTFFLVRTVGALDFGVEVLEGTVRIEAEGRALPLEHGKSADKRGKSLVVSPLRPDRENDLALARLRLLGPGPAEKSAPPLPGKGLAREPGRARAAPPVRGTTPAPAMPPLPVNPEAAKGFHDKLRDYQPAGAPDRKLPDALAPAPGREAEAALEKAWSAPEGRPYAVREGVEIWRADRQKPVRWYEELGEFEFKFGGTGREVEDMAVRRASRMGASGFIVLAAGRMDSSRVIEMEFRRGRAQDLTMNGMDLKQYGDVYDSENFATRSRMKQEAFFMRVKIFRYY